MHLIFSRWFIFKNFLSQINCQSVNMLLKKIHKRSQRVFTRLKMSIPVKKSKESYTLTPLKSIKATTSSIQDILRRVWPPIVRLVFASKNQFWILSSTSLSLNTSLINYLNLFKQDPCSFNPKMHLQQHYCWCRGFLWK